MLRRRTRDAGGGERRAGRPFAVGFFLAIFLLLGGLYAAGYALTSDRVPRTVSVAGVEIGGLRPAQAHAKLQRELVPRADDPIVAHDGDDTYRIDPDQAGLSLDVAATVDSAGGGRSLNPLRMVQVLTGGEDVEPVVEVDRAALDAELAAVADQVRREPVEGDVEFVRGRPVPVYPTTGRSLDTAATAQAVRAAFLDTEQELDLPVERVPTQLSEHDVDTAVQRFAEPAMSAGVRVQADSRSARLTPVRIGAALSMEPRKGELVPRVDPDRLATSAAPVVDRLTRNPRPATVVIRNSSPQVAAGEAGTALSMRVLARKVLRALTQEGAARSVRIATEPQPPDFGSSDARKLRIREVVSRFTTYFPHSDYRNTNLGRAAEKINGTVLKPGEVFSLNDVVGERTAKNGFTRGFVISDGVLVEDFGGGVSQVATTVYNAAFFAGLKDIEHHPHSLYFDRYPMGREATVAWGALDLRFENDTPHGILIETWIEPSTPTRDGVMHARMWSTEHWDIRAGLSEQYDFTEPDVRYDPSPQCVAQIGFSGFEVDVFRYFHRDGERVRTEKQHVTYDPADTVHCRPEPEP